jgi:hypothetical protein
MDSDKVELFILPPGMVANDQTPLVIAGNMAGTVTMLNVRFSTHKHNGRRIPKLTGKLDRALPQKRQPVKSGNAFRLGTITPTGQIIDSNNMVVKSAKAAYVVGRKIYFV